MNTANPQLEGLYLALGSVFELLVEKGVFSREELHEALERSEDIALRGDELPSDSDSRRMAMAFPIRLLLAASRHAEAGERPAFRDLAREVGRQT